MIIDKDVRQWCTDSQTIEEIKKYYQASEYGSYIVDPHTAVGLTAQARSAKKA